MSDKLKVYLAGAMSGKTKEEMDSWRLAAYKELVRFAEGRLNVIDPSFYYNTSMDSDVWDYKDKEYIRWELRNVKNCNLLIARVEDGFSSLGTMAEITTAYNHDIPIILYVDNKHNQEIHPFISEMCDKVFDDLSELGLYVADYYVSVI